LTRQFFRQHTHTHTHTIEEIRKPKAGLRHEIEISSINESKMLLANLSNCPLKTSSWHLTLNGASKGAPRRKSLFTFVFHSPKKMTNYISRNRTARSRSFWTKNHGKDKVSRKGERPHSKNSNISIININEKNMLTVFM